MRTLLFLLIPITCIAQKKLIPVEFGESTSHQAVAIKEYRGFTVYAECFEIKRDLIVFDIEVENNSGDFLDVDPQEMYYYASEDPFPQPDTDDFYHPHNNGAFTSFGYAQTERGVQDYYERKIRTREGTKTLLFVLGAGLVLYDAVKDGQDFSRELTAKSVKNSVARDVIVESSLMAIDVAGTSITENQIKADEDLFYLQDEMLAYQLVDDQSFARGKVYFRQKYKHRFYRVIIPVEDNHFIFDFRWPTPKEFRNIRK